MKTEFPVLDAPRQQPTYSPWEAVFAGRSASIPPQFRDQFLRSPAEPFVPVIKGRMTHVWHRRGLGLVFRWLARHGILVASAGRDVPMTLTMLPRLSARGAPYNVCGRLFEFGQPARWDTIKTWDPRLGRIVEYVGHRRRLKVVLETRYDGARLLTFETEQVALRTGARWLWLPKWFWRTFFGVMSFAQVANEDGRTIAIRLTLSQSLLGKVFGYEGTFEVLRSDDEDSLAA